MKCKKPRFIKKTGITARCYYCIACRLTRANEKAIRTYHESKFNEHSIFLTLTYSDEYLPSSGKLHYPHFQEFIKNLRRNTPGPISYMVTGEYGDKTKRPHYHAIIFGAALHDAKKLRNSPEGLVCTSALITKLWKYGFHEFGTVTIKSAQYVAMYATKKLVHGRDKEHSYEPTHNSSKTHTFGKRWIEKYWEQTLQQGNITLPNGKKAPIPRYYREYIKKNHPKEYDHWMTIHAKKNKEKEIDNLRIFGSQYVKNRLTDAELIRIEKTRLLNIKGN